MNLILKDDLRRIINNISTGVYDHSTMFHFFATIRSIMKAENMSRPVLRELADFHAHREGRDKGETHEQIKKFFTEFIKFGENGGSMPHPNIFYSQNYVMGEIYIFLKRFDIQYNELLLKYSEDESPWAYATGYQCNPKDCISQIALLFAPHPLLLVFQYIV